MTNRIRCPSCNEVLYLKEEEFDTEIACPRCKRKFVWSEVLKETVTIHCPSCKEELRVEKRSLFVKIGCPRCKKQFIPSMTPEGKWAREVERRERRERIKRRIREREEMKRREEETRVIAIREPSYRCVKCGVAISESDIREGRASREGDDVYCLKHIPRLKSCPACGWEVVSRFAMSCPRCDEPIITPTPYEMLKRIEQALLKIHEDLKRLQRSMIIER